MMKKLIFLFVIMLSLSCKKSNIKSYPDFIGTWSITNGTVSITFTVSEKGKSTYEEVTQSGASRSTVKYRGKFILKDKILSVGRKEFTIQQFPSQDAQQVWHLKMSNILLRGR